MLLDMLYLCLFSVHCHRRYHHEDIFIDC
jgi:hypothetical protein